MSGNAKADLKLDRGARRRYPLALRLRVLQLLFGRSRRFSFSRRLNLLARRYRIAARTIWRWVALYRKGGANALRDLLRGDTLTRRAPANVTSITPGSLVRLPLDDQHNFSQDAVSSAKAQKPRTTKVPL